MCTQNSISKWSPWKHQLFLAPAMSFCNCPLTESSVAIENLDISHFLGYIFFDKVAAFYLLWMK